MDKTMQMIPCRYNADIMQMIPWRYIRITEIFKTKNTTFVIANSKKIDKRFKTEIQFPLCYSSGVDRGLGAQTN